MKWISSTLVLGMGLAMSTMIACSPSDQHSSNENVARPVDVVAGENEVIKARAVIAVVPGSQDQNVVEPSDQLMELSAVGTVPIDIINAPNTTIKFDTSKFKIPAISNAILNFGTIAVSSLIDNALDVCGQDKKTKCKKAFIRFYTTGVKGAGIWNAVGGYGMPITVVSAKPFIVGLEPDNAAYVVSVDIADTKHVMNLADLLPTSKYTVSSDFRNAGAGAYSTNLVIEYGLAD